MSLVRWNPFSDVDTLFHRLATLPRVGFDTDGGKQVQWSPSVDISETDQEYVVKAELPAVKKEDLKVTVDSGTLTIKGERKLETEENGKKFHRIETFYGSFERSFALPENVDGGAISCESKDGVLTVHLPKTAPQKTGARQISVQ